MRSPFKTRPATFGGWFLSFGDVTEKEAAEKLKIEFVQVSSILDSISSNIFIIDPATYKILFANKVAIDSFHQPLIGKICYETLQGLENPARFVRMRQYSNIKAMPTNGSTTIPCSTAISKFTDKIITWSDGNDVKLRARLMLPSASEWKRICEKVRSTR